MKFEEYPHSQTVVVNIEKNISLSQYLAQQIDNSISYSQYLSDFGKETRAGKIREILNRIN